MPKVSIIIPLYNKAPYIRKALDSVCAQTYQDWECIIMDDGSTDDSAAVVNQWLENNSCRCGCLFRLLSQSNAGVAAARNNAVAQSKGECLCFLDADDWWKPTFLEEMVSFVESNPGAGLWASNYVYYRPGKTRVGVTNLVYESSDRNIINYPKSYAQGTGMPVWTGAVMMLKSRFEEFSGFPVGVRLGEDFLLWAQISLQYPILFLEKPLAYYNNDVPASMRATRNLHQPQHHMIFLLDGLEKNIVEIEEPLRSDWNHLLAKLRADGLLAYWVDSRYHYMACRELKKIDWSYLPTTAKRPYDMPVRRLKKIMRILEIGSSWKLKLNRFLGE